MAEQVVLKLAKFDAEYTDFAFSGGRQQIRNYDDDLRFTTGDQKGVGRGLLHC